MKQELDQEKVTDRVETFAAHAAFFWEEKKDYSRRAGKGGFWDLSPTFPFVLLLLVSFVYDRVTTPSISLPKPGIPSLSTVQRVLKQVLT
jgi:hypothetical protein